MNNHSEVLSNIPDEVLNALEEWKILEVVKEVKSEKLKSEKKKYVTFDLSANVIFEEVQKFKVGKGKSIKLKFFLLVKLLLGLNQRIPPYLIIFWRDTRFTESLLYKILRCTKLRKFGCQRLLKVNV